MIFASGFRTPKARWPCRTALGWLWRAAPSGGASRTSAQMAEQARDQEDGRPNGLAVDANGVIWVAESKVPSLLRFTLDGKCEVVPPAVTANRFCSPTICALVPMVPSISRIPACTSKFRPQQPDPADYKDIEYDGRVYPYRPARAAVGQNR